MRTLVSTEYLELAIKVRKLHEEHYSTPIHDLDSDFVDKIVGEHCGINPDSAISFMLVRKSIRAILLAKEDTL